MAYSYDDRDREFRQSPPPRPPRKEDNDLGSWILIIFLFIVAWPAGLAVLLSKVLGNDSRRKNAARSTRSTVSRSDPAVSRADPNPSQARPGTASAAGRKVTKTPQYSAKAARNMKIVGLVLLFAGLVSLVEGIGAATGGLSWALLASLFPTMGLAAGGLGLLLAGGVMTRRARRFGKYLACAHGQEAVSLKKLAEAADVSPRKVENDLEIMIEKGLWGENAYLDLGSDMLFRSPEAAEAFFGKKKQEQEVQEPPQAEQGYSGILRDIRRANDRIADPVLSQKIDRLEEVAGKIFRIIEKEPAKKAKASTFLNYYLPTTQKLLDSYLAEQAAAYLGAAEKPDFDPLRRDIVHLRELPFEERQRLAAENPAYGNIVCRCEGISEGEIVDAIRRTPGARSLDGVKRRVRAGMGWKHLRCHCLCRH